MRAPASHRRALLAIAGAALATAAFPAGAAAAPAAAPAQAAAPASPAAAVPAAVEAQTAPAPPPLIGPPVSGGLTADEAATRAAASSRDVAARTEEVHAAEAGLSQARAAYVPRLSGTARYTRLSPLDAPSLGTLVASPGAATGPLAPGAPLVAVPLQFPVIVDQYVTQATLVVPLSDYLSRLPRLSEAAAGNARAAALMADAARLRAATEGRLAFYGWARAKLQADVAANAVAQARAHLGDVNAARAAGAASKADVLRVESQVASAELVLTRARAATQVMDRRLRTLMHDDSGRRYEIGEDLRDASFPTPVTAEAAATPGTEEALVREALDARLEVQALIESAGALRSQAKAARAVGLPRLDAVGNAVYARPNTRIFPLKDEFRGTWDVSVQLTFTPTDLFGTEAARRGSLARARAVDADRAALADGISLEVTQSLQALREAEAALATSERGLAAAEESYRVRRSLFQNGRATSVELTDAEVERSRAQLEAVGARVDRRTAAARLAFAIGRGATAREGR